METKQRNTTEQEIEALDLAKYVRKIASRDPGRWTDDELALMPREYRRFLHLRLRNHGTPLVPSRIMDAVWHEHILDTRVYAVDMERLFGGFVHHEPVYDAQEGDVEHMEDLAGQTAELYEATFGEAMPGVSARCAGKACHAPSNCRCR